jgi:hypothetical protein
MLEGRRRIVLAVFLKLISNVIPFKYKASTPNTGESVYYYGHTIACTTHLLLTYIPTTITITTPFLLTVYAICNQLIKITCRYMEHSLTSKQIQSDYMI